MFRETVARWHREATKKASKQGYEQGIKQGMIRVLSAQFEVRYGSNEGQLVRLDALTSEQLTTLAVRFAQLPDATEEELFALEED